MKIVLHEKTYINCRNSKEESSPIIFHLMYNGFIPLNKPKYRLEREYTSASEISFRILSLEAKPDPFLSGYFGRLIKVLGIKTLNEVPSLIFSLKEDIGLLFERIVRMQLLVAESVVLTKEPLSPVPALDVGLGL